MIFFIQLYFPLLFFLNFIFMVSVFYIDIWFRLICSIFNYLYKLFYLLPARKLYLFRYYSLCKIYAFYILLYIISDFLLRNVISIIKDNRKFPIYNFVYKSSKSFYLLSFPIQMLNTKYLKCCFCFLFRYFYYFVAPAPYFLHIQLFGWTSTFIFCIVTFNRCSDSFKKCFFTHLLKPYLLFLW